MATLFIDDVQRIVGANLTDAEFAAISPLLAGVKGQAAILELFAGLIRQLMVDRRKDTIERLKNTLEAATDGKLAEYDQAIAAKG